MKACKFILPILLAFLLLTGCSGENTPIRPVSLSEIQNGDAVWCRANGKIYYSNGGKVFSCNAAGKDTEFVCKLPRKLRKNFVTISAATADNLIIQCGKRACNYYSLNIQTGESVLLFENILYNSLQVLCSSDSTLFSLQKPQKANYDPILINTVREEETVYVLSTNIDTAESELLGHISINGGISNADGAVSESRLFFVCKPATGMYSISLTGGDVEFILPDTQAIPEMDEVVSLEEKDGVLYMLMQSETANPKSALCKYDPQTNKALPVVTIDNTFAAKNFLIDGNAYYLFDESNSLSGQLQSSY